MRTKDETAQFIADAHFRLNHEIDRIFRIVESDEADSTKPVKLLEVNEITPEAGIMPIGLGADPHRGVHFGVTVVEITPTEFERLVRGELVLPKGWSISNELHPTNEPAEAAP